MSFEMSKDTEVFSLIERELHRQQHGIELIASENFVSKAVMDAVGSILTNKYAEGYPGRRYYGGCVYHDEIETIAKSRALKLFGAEHANVQPHSGANANLAAYFALVKPGDTILAMNLDHGGHLTHGARVNFSGKLYNIVPYGVKKETGRIDYDELETIALSCNPKLIVAGASAYARTIDFERFAAIAKLSGAKLMVDMAHIAGLVAAGIHPSPVPHADVVTSTTHKTLRGPRGGLILCRRELQKKIDSAVFPGSQGGPLMHVIAAKAVAFREALQPEFKVYQKQVVANAAVLASELQRHGFEIVSGGTDNHLVLVNLENTGVTGQEAENRLAAIDIIVNKNKVPFDKASAMVTSGMRLGTAALTTRGMAEDEMKEIASLIRSAVFEQESVENLRARAQDLTKDFPIYPKLAY